MVDRYGDARIDPFCAVHRYWRPRRLRRHACPWSLAMEYNKIQWLVDWTRDLLGGARRGRSLETVRARSKIPVERWTQRFMGNKQASGLSALTTAVSSSEDYFMSGLSRKPTNQTRMPSLFPRTTRPPRPDTSKQPDQFRSLNASLLYCPSCRVATPTRERLLLVLPTGNLYEYLCQHCGTSTGSKTDNE
jgi:hypothetical protein